MSIIYPAYFLTVRRDSKAWYFRHGEVFYSGRNSTDDSLSPSCLENREEQYGLTKEKVVIELFRLQAGRVGYYLINMRDKKYYYCGLDFEDIQSCLHELGIGRVDPLSKSYD